MRRSREPQAAQFSGSPPRRFALAGDTSGAFASSGCRASAALPRLACLVELVSLGIQCAQYHVCVNEPPVQVERVPEFLNRLGQAAALGMFERKVVMVPRLVDDERSMEMSFSQA